MALTTEIEHKGTLADMLEHLRKMANEAEQRGKRRGGDSSARHRAAGMRDVIEVLERWTPTPSGAAPVPSFGHNQPGPEHQPEQWEARQ